MIGKRKGAKAVTDVEVENTIAQGNPNSVDYLVVFSKKYGARGQMVTATGDVSLEDVVKTAYVEENSPKYCTGEVSIYKLLDPVKGSISSELKVTIDG